MSESKHTPGSWKITQGIKIYIVPTESDKMICEISYAYAKEFPMTNEELLANAMLIAAAPDLLDACKVGMRFTKTVALADTRSISKGDCEDAKRAFELIRDFIAEAEKGD